MKLLLFSDVHAHEERCLALVALAEMADIVIGAGDFGNLRRQVNSTVDILTAIKKPTIVVPGNAESYDELVASCRNWPEATVLHGSGTTVNGVRFYGIGGGIPVTPFGSWSYDFSEDEARELLADCPEGAILITHSPPKGVVDMASNGLSLGSVAIREIILAKSPPLVVCGHIHESAGQQIVVGESVVINAGPAGIFWELPTK
ncbi:MAG: serine/threonine protein phosphatase [Chloroflexi bacterium]|nr:MAG: serine/threonine protein phosphatase [Chloroflexota bacterium]